MRAWQVPELGEPLAVLREAAARLPRAGGSVRASMPVR